MATHRKILKDEYGPAMNWFKYAIQNLNLKDEQEVKPDPKLEGQY
jgi:soluble epoxide hydrolase/lipid-phosphate phosphatase